MCSTKEHDEALFLLPVIPFGRNRQNIHSKLAKTGRVSSTTTTAVKGFTLSFGNSEKQNDDYSIDHCSVGRTTAVRWLEFRAI